MQYITIAIYAAAFILPHIATCQSRLNFGRKTEEAMRNYEKIEKELDKALADRDRITRETNDLKQPENTQERSRLAQQLGVNKSAIRDIAFSLIVDGAIIEELYNASHNANRHKNDARHVEAVEKIRRIVKKAEDAVSQPKNAPKPARRTGPIEVLFSFATSFVRNRALLTYYFPYYIKAKEGN